MTAEQITRRAAHGRLEVFGFGAAIGVPRVFAARDAEVRLRILELHRGLWGIAQPLYGAGAIVAALAVGYLASGSADGRSRTALWGACAALLTGVWRGAGRYTCAAPGSLLRCLLDAAGVVVAPTSSSRSAGSCCFGVGLLLGGFPTWCGWLTCGASVTFLIVYVLSRDIPPFVFYILLTGFGVMVL